MSANPKPTNFEKNEETEVIYLNQYQKNGESKHLSIHLILTTITLIALTAGLSYWFYRLHLHV